MLATRVRDSPCSARTWPSSLGLVTVSTPSFWAISMGSASSIESWPLGPLTVTWRPLIVTSTPLGMVTGSRPIRDMRSPLPDVGEDFPAHAAPDRLLVGQQATRGGDDGDAQSAKHPRQIVLFRVHPEPGLGHALEPGDRALTGRPVLERDHQVLADLGVGYGPFADVALLLEDLGDVNLDLGIGHAYGVLICRIGVTQTGQHVCDRVGHRHGLVALLTVVSSSDLRRGRWAPAAPRLVVGAALACARVALVTGGYQLDFVMPGSSPRCAMVRKQIRHSPNRRYTARGRPQRVHLV